MRLGFFAIPKTLVLHDTLEYFMTLCVLGSRIRLITAVATKLLRETRLGKNCGLIY